MGKQVAKAPLVGKKLNVKYTILSTPEANIIGNHVLKEWQTNQPKGSWTTVPELPQPSELLQATQACLSEPLETAPASFLPPNNISQPWNSSSEFLRTHYKLNREDAIAPLRKAVDAVRRAPDMREESDIAIYSHVHLTQYLLSQFGPAARIEFLPDRCDKKVKWQQSNRLRVGSVVALSPSNDMFSKTCKIAVVADRQIAGGLDQDPPSICISWADTADADIDPTISYVMVESRSSYFESSRHMLLALQQLSTEQFPLKEQLLSFKQKDQSPQYVLAKRKADFSCIWEAPKNSNLSKLLQNFDVLRTWPNFPRSKLNKSQLEALQRILTQKVAIVQGPPGTGKTFVSVTALKIQLSTFGPGDPPIVISAETNQALDQILILLMPFIEKSFVRLGSRYNKSNEDLHSHSLHELRTRTGNPSFKKKTAAKERLRHVYESLGQFVTKELNTTMLDPQKLLQYKVITPQQFDSLCASDWESSSDKRDGTGALQTWLGDQLIPSHSRCPSIIRQSENDESDSELEDIPEVLGDGFEDGRLSDMLLAPPLDLTETMTGKLSPGWSESKIRKLLSKTDDLYQINRPLRGSVYRYLQRRLRVALLPGFRQKFKEAMEAVEKLKLARMESDALLLKNLHIKLIACTTTGLAKYRGLIASLKPRVLLIEEAAQCLEARVMSGMFESLQHLILVGDHQQLPAHCSTRELERPPYSLTTSTFERLVNNGFGFTMLNEQRRMRPEIRQMLSSFYPTLMDHSLVMSAKHRPPVPGMGSVNTFFFTHRWLETQFESISWQNQEEAKMIVEFFNYLVLNGVEPSHITVLTYYRGQRSLILRMMKSHPGLIDRAEKPNNWNVFTVDSYQGEENDIILLSLVRGNSAKAAGFVDSRNRAVVALSRARRGLYVFGNSDTLFSRGSTSSDVWSQVASAFQTQNRLGYQLPISCSSHGTTIKIKCYFGWQEFSAHGGCSKKCLTILNCGHRCPYRCHPFPHDQIACHETCSKKLSCGHSWRGRCNEEPSCRFKCTDFSRQTHHERTSIEARLQSSLDETLEQASLRAEGDRVTAAALAAVPMGLVYHEKFIHIKVQDGKRVDAGEKPIYRIVSTGVPPVSSSSSAIGVPPFQEETPLDIPSSSASRETTEPGSMPGSPLCLPELCLLDSDCTGGLKEMALAPGFLESLPSVSVDTSEWLLTME